ncbi:MAG: VWA domain-containing protein, partial [Elusimicrobia bacterium]|nr:VWA domain-containing protein [Elusimicrobiota bacterium]
MNKKIPIIIFTVLFCFPCLVFPYNKIKNIEIILDASESMNNEIEGEKKIDIAKEVISKMLSLLSPQSTGYLKIGLRTFGEEREMDAGKDSRLLVPIREVNLRNFEETLGEITPKGYSPIAHSILMAGYDFPFSEDKMIILITDGKETCGGDPVKAVKRLQREGINVVVNIIGFDVDEDDNESLAEITSTSGGTYTDVINAKSLELNFEKIIGTKNFVKKPERKKVMEKIRKKTFLKKSDIQKKPWIVKKSEVIKKSGIIKKPGGAKKSEIVENLGRKNGSEKKAYSDREIVSFKRDEWIETDPVAAMKYSLIFPGLGQFYTDRPVKGIIDFVTAWTLIGFNCSITQLHEYRTDPQVSFTKDFLDFSCINYYISGAAGVYFYTEKRNNKDHWKIKSPEGAFLRSLIIPGWGQLYIAENPEAGFSYMCWTGFFYYKLYNPVPHNVDSTH